MTFANEVTTEIIGGKVPNIASGNSSSFNDVNLNGFFSRWTEIADYSWSPTATQGTVLFDIDPWSLILTQPEISRKWNNFMKIRANLEVQFMVNGAQTFFGDVIVAGVPMGTKKYDLPYTKDFTATPVVLETLPIMWNLPQCIHGHIDPCLSEVVVLQLPWCSPLDALELNVAADGISPFQWNVRAVVIAPLGSTTGLSSTPSLTISVMARLVDVELEIPISYEMKSGGHGKISSSLSRGGVLMGSIANLVPSVAPVAGVASTVLSVAGAVADFFGFTKETGSQSTTLVRPMLSANAANADGVDTAGTVALLEKNTVSRDPAIGGVPAGVDQESFADLFVHPTLIEAQGWTTSQTRGTILLRLPVQPVFGATQTGSTYLPPVGLVGTCFKFWRGPMYYTFRIACSVQHRGRLQVFYCPNTSGSDAVDPTNMSYNCIWDISPGGTKTFRVGYTKPIPFLQCGTTAGLSNFYSEGFDNGYLALRIINPLTSPDPTASVVVQVYAHSDGDMQFMGPRIATEVAYQAGNSADVAGAHTIEIIDLVGSKASEVDVSAICGGERITSIRTLCQRFFPVEVYPWWINAATSFGPFYQRFTQYPFFPPPNVTAAPPYVGPGAGRLQTGHAGGGAFNMSHTFSYLKVFATMFLGWRGTTRHKFAIPQSGFSQENAVTTSGIPNVVDFTVSNVGYTIPSATWGLLANPDSANISNMNGIIPFDANQAAMAEFNFPYYSPRRFELTRVYEDPTHQTYGANSSYLGTSYAMCFQVQYCCAQYPDLDATYPGLDPKNASIRRWEAAGDDFSLVHFRYVRPVIFS
jgi:hypothetical protein